MIRISQLKLPVSHTREELEAKISRELQLKDREFSYVIRRQSLDARKKKDKKFVYTIDVTVTKEKQILKKVHNKNIMLTNEEAYRFPCSGTEPLTARPVIVGTGPAGLFCGWYLARAGYCPILLERGEPAGLRKEKVEQFWKTGKLDPQSNVQFGEGGAGTFSDGKLNTLVKDPCGRNQEVLRRFVAAGAPEEILYQQKPHLGTDTLIGLVEKLRAEIEEMGGQVYFSSQVTDIEIQDGRIQAVVINQEKRLETQILVLAIGHSARDTFEMLQEKKVPMEPKSFAVGVRVEHPQTMINLALYGEEENPALGAASYKVTHKCENTRGVYSFCMCPGGYVVNASSEPGRLAVNGMSYQARDSRNANSAVIVTVNPQDYPQSGPLGGVAFQRDLEEKAYQLASGKIPVQLYEDFCQNRASRKLGEVRPQIKGEWEPANLRQILPGFVGEGIEEGIRAFGKKIQGFDRPDCLLSGIESRTSSPVRILRNSELESALRGLYPCGEGAGYAGGITSAAMDGIRTAEAIARKYRGYH